MGSIGGKDSRKRLHTNGAECNLRHWPDGDHASQASTAGQAILVSSHSVLFFMDGGTTESVPQRYLPYTTVDHKISGATLQMEWQEWK